MLNLLKRNITRPIVPQLNRVLGETTQSTYYLNGHTRFYFADNPNPQQNKESNQNKKGESQQDSNKTQDNKQSMFANPWVTAGLSALAGFGAYYLYQQKINRKTIPKRDEIKIPFENNPQAVPQVQIGGPWTLTDFNSQPFGSADLKGSNYLIYFGFSKCPDICPTTLLYLSSMMRHLRSLPDYKDIKLKLVFVSLDPQRDSPQKLKKWLSKFDKQIIGVVAQSPVDENLQKIKKDFKIYANKIYTPEDDDPQNQSGYKIDHTALVYLMNENNEFIDLVNLVSNEKEEAVRLMKKIKGQKAGNK